MIKVILYKLKDINIKPITTNDLEIFKEIEFETQRLPIKDEEKPKAIKSIEKLRVGDIFSIEIENNIKFYKVADLGIPEINIEIYIKKGNFTINNWFDDLEDIPDTQEEIDLPISDVDELSKFTEFHDALLNRHSNSNDEQKSKPRERVSILLKIAQMQERISLLEEEKKKK